MGLYELMTMTPAVRRLLNRDADDHSIREQAFKDGMKPLRVSGAMKVAAGMTTVEEGREGRAAGVARNATGHSSARFPRPRWSGQIAFHSGGPPRPDGFRRIRRSPAPK
jgi:hypothetical protein